MFENLRLVLGVVISLTCASGYNLTVKTNAGYVRGYEAVSDYKGVTYYSFKGIPYAEPPIGSLRFQDPQSVSPWEGVKDVLEHGSNCASTMGSPTNPVYGNEDCLYLNVYVPQTEKENEDVSLPVMVWIHGGGFLSGHSGFDVGLDPSYMMEKPIIVVSLNYRLGVLGFLSTLDENARGNAGLKDQVMALKWVRNNIAKFGGDPTKVTLFGQSSGGGSVEFHMLSPLSAGLFRHALVQSGSTLNEWAIQTEIREITLQLAKDLNVTSTNTAEIVAALQNIDYKTLIENSFTHGAFRPSIEAESEYAFINRSSYDIWESGKFTKVPLLIGYNEEEGAYNGLDDVKYYAENPSNYIPIGLNIDANSSAGDEIVELIKKKYFPDGNLLNITNALHLMTQKNIARPLRKTVAEAIKASVPTYFYEFFYVGNSTNGINGGPAHGDELQYIWHRNNLTTAADINTKDRMVTMWTNFAIYGNPTPRRDEILSNIIWPEATKGLSGDDVNYLKIGNDLVVGTNPDQDDYLFWRDIFQKYAQGTIYIY